MYILITKAPPLLKNVGLFSIQLGTPLYSLALFAYSVYEVFWTVFYLAGYSTLLTGLFAYSFYEVFWTVFYIAWYSTLLTGLFAYSFYEVFWTVFYLAWYSTLLTGLPSMASSRACSIPVKKQPCYYNKNMNRAGNATFVQHHNNDNATASLGFL